MSHTPDGPIVPGEGLRVCAEMCDTCVFRPGNVMYLRSGRLRDMVNGSLRDDSAIACHKTLDGARAVCRGFWDRHKHDTLMCRLGLATRVIEVNPDDSA
jgi:hypothetical protein